jgi:hypothetical protein
MEGSTSVGGNAVFPVEMTLAVTGGLCNLSADRRETAVTNI